MDTVGTDVQEGVCWITLDRPQALNALNARMEDELLDALGTAADDPGVRVVVLRGAGRCFSAGHDVKEMGTRARAGSLPGTLLALEKPVVASVHGYVLGAALSIALACDLRIAAFSARLAMPFVRSGVVGGTWLLPRVVGLACATRLLFLGDEVDGREAERLGLVHRAVEDDELAGVTADVAARLAQAPTAAIGIMKRAMHDGYGLAATEGLASEAAALGRVRGTSDYDEGRAAARERRSPRFEGR